MDTGSEKPASQKGTERGPDAEEERERAPQRGHTAALRCPWEWRGKGWELEADHPRQSRLSPGRGPQVGAPCTVQAGGEEGTTPGESSWRESELQRGWEAGTPGERRNPCRQVTGSQELSERSCGAVPEQAGWGPGRG